MPQVLLLFNELSYFYTEKEKLYKIVFKISFIFSSQLSETSFYNHHNFEYLHLKFYYLFMNVYSHQKLHANSS